MRLIMKSGDRFANLRVDAVEKEDDVIFAYKCPVGSLAATEFVGCFDLGSMDFLYVTEERSGSEA